MHESKAIRESEKHRKCFIMTKFLFGQINYWTEGDKYLKQYHAKVAFLTHCQTCGSRGMEMNDCICDILVTLLNTYRSKSETLQLPDYHFNKKLNICNKYGNVPAEGMQASISVMLRSFCEILTFTEVVACEQWNEHFTAECIRRLKRTVQFLLGGKLWIAKGFSKYTPL